MAVKQGKTLIGLRPSEEDLKLLSRLERKLGGNPTSILRQALRVLAQKEGVAA